MPSRKTFDLPYAGVDKSGPEHLLIGLDGSLSIILSLQNPVVVIPPRPLHTKSFTN
jgi:hypothetical protein